MKKMSVQSSSLHGDSSQQQDANSNSDEGVERGFSDPIQNIGQTAQAEGEKLTKKQKFKQNMKDKLAKVKQDIKENHEKNKVAIKDLKQKHQEKFKSLKERKRMATETYKAQQLVGSQGRNLTQVGTDKNNSGNDDDSDDFKVTVFKENPYLNENYLDHNDSTSFLARLPDVNSTNLIQKDVQIVDVEAMDDEG